MCRMDEYGGEPELEGGWAMEGGVAEGAFPALPLSWDGKEQSRLESGVLACLAPTVLYVDGNGRSRSNLSRLFLTSRPLPPLQWNATGQVGNP